MALATHLLDAGCEHLDATAFAKIKDSRSSATATTDPHFIQYTCLDCPTVGSFASLDKHFQKSKHEFAVSSSSIYCGKCNDLVYEPSNIMQATSAKKRKITQLSEEDDSYMTANTSQRPCGREGVRGLFNLGETCYMNAVLQMMIHNPLLASYFLGMGHPIHLCPISREPEKKNDSDSEEDEESEDKPEQKSCVACGMTEVFSDATMPDQPLPAHAVNLLFASWKNIPHMQGKGQQDAQEWFMLIVEKLHDAITSNSDSRYRCDCFFHKVFFGRHNSEVTCDKCNATSITEEEYSSISLDFKKQIKRKKKALPDIKTAIPNVHECLRTYTAPEPLSPDQYKCRSCEAPRQATKRVRIRKLPAILCVHVKRFGMKISNGAVSQEKYEGKIEYPLVLDMTPYTTNPKSLDSAEPDKFIYDLECVVVHQGENAHQGHYFAFCRQDAKWFRFDDEMVTATTTGDVMGQEAYLLFYSLRSIGTL